MSAFGQDPGAENTAYGFVHPFPSNTEKRLDLNSIQDLIGPVTSKQRGYLHSDMLHLKDYYSGRSMYLSTTVMDQIRMCNSFLIQDIFAVAVYQRFEHHLGNAESD